MEITCDRGQLLTLDMFLSESIFRVSFLWHLFKADICVKCQELTPFPPRSAPFRRFSQGKNSFGETHADYSDSLQP